MSSKHKYNCVQFIRATFICMVLLLLAVCTQRVFAATGINANGDYDDGELIWSKILPQQYTYQNAVNFCLNKPPSQGIQWELPTGEQLKHFYQHVAMKSLEKSRSLNGWSLGLSWVSGEVTPNKHEVIDLDYGNYDLNGEQDTLSRFTVCVAPKISNYFYDEKTKLTWLKINAKKQTLDNAKSYCAAMSNNSGNTKPWVVPTMDQMKQFRANVLASKEKKDYLSKIGWIFDMTWSSTVTKNGEYCSCSGSDDNCVWLMNLKDGGTNYECSKPGQHDTGTEYVTCTH